MSEEQQAAAKGAEEQGAESKKQSERLLELVEAKNTDLWSTPEGEQFMTFPVGDDHRENHRIGSKQARFWLARLFYKEEGKPPSANALQEALGVLAGKALFEGETHEVHVRHAAAAGKIYIDLGDADWTVFEISPDGWDVADDVPVRFRRPGGMQPLPWPKQGEPGRGLRAGLKESLNVDDDGLTLVIGHIVGAMAPEGPYPPIDYLGEQGSAKSSAARYERNLLDPNSAPLRSAPRDERDLVIAASNGRVVCLDNLSSLSPSLSDAICRLASGGGFATRTLYSDDEETIFSATRPVILTGINEVAERGDLADRTIFVTLLPIPEGKRLPEQELRRREQENAPKMLGALFTATSAALRRLPEVKLDSYPRMADHVAFVTAAEQELGLPAGAYAKAFRASQEVAVETVLGASPLTEPLHAFLAEQDEREWKGPTGELLGELEEGASDGVKRSREWPKNASVFGKELNKLAPDLRTIGIEVDKKGRDSGSRSKRFRCLTALENFDPDRYDRSEPGGKEEQGGNIPSHGSLPSQNGGDPASGADSGGDGNATGATGTATGGRQERDGQIPLSRAESDRCDGSDGNFQGDSFSDDLTPEKEAEIERLADRWGPE